MSTRDTLEDQSRRDRVNRMKRFIIGFLVVFVVFSLTAIIALTAMTVSLSGRLRHIEKLLTDQTSKKQAAPLRPGVELADGDSEKSGTESISEEPTEMESGIEDEENLAKAGDTHKVYLTFDGGPDDNTDTILDVLKNQGARATFFVNANDASKMKSVYRRIVADGHTLGMRSYSNRYSEIYTSGESFSKDLEKISDFLFKITGMKSRFYRFPGGSGNEISNVKMASLAKILNEKNITYFDWNVTADDLAVDSTSDDVVASVVKGVKKYKTSVVLLHEGMDRDTTARALGSLIDALKLMKAEILPIDENTYKVQYIKSDELEHLK